MKRYILILLLGMVMATAVARPRNREFNPKRFQAELESFIANRAGLTPKQASRFFPLFREMQKKQRVLFTEMRQYQHIDLADEAACARAIQRMDKIDVQIRTIQMEYHQKFMAILPANVVMKILRAEDMFHRMAFRRAAKRECPPDR